MHINLLIGNVHMLDYNAVMLVGATSFYAGVSATSRHNVHETAS